jgi:Ca-activated chloride channel family protein
MAGARGLPAGIVAAAALAAAVHAAPGPSPPQQPQRPVFRAGTDTVAVYATVLDAEGRLVTDLTREAFEVRDNGRPQTLTHFDAGQQPITALVLLDTSQSMTLSLEPARFAAEQFMIRLQAGDRARFGTFNDRFQIDPAFLEGRDDLVRTVRAERHISNGTRLWDAMDLGRRELNGIGGRRILVVLTDGEDTFSEALGYDVYQQMREDELMFYAIQFPRAGPYLIEKVPPPTMSEFFRFGGHVVSGSGRSLPSPGDVLRRFAWHTGGGYAFIGRETNASAVVTQLVREMHFQYVLGFTPQAFDGQMHDLDVRVSREDVEVRARKAYRAEKRP